MPFISVPGHLHRRQFLAFLGGAALSLVAGPAAAAPGYRVGVGRGQDPYAAAAAALDAAPWPPGRMAGRRVLIKPNLVAAAPASSGVTTDPEIVRLVAERCLADGATEVLIVEGGPGVHFAACGYGPLGGAGGGRVRLVDLAAEPSLLVPVPGGSACSALWLPELLLNPEIVFISVAKLKTHQLATATLSTKSLFGLPPCPPYRLPRLQGRHGLHFRGVHQVIADLVRLRPIDYALVDGIVGLEGNGPLAGTPVPMGQVLAGVNAVAVDRVGLAAMGIGQGLVPHLHYLAAAGLGPFSLDEIELAGSALRQRPFQRPVLPPLLYGLWPEPAQAAPGQACRIVAWLGEPADCRLELVATRPEDAEGESLGVLASSRQGRGLASFIWDGRLGGQVLPPARYRLRLAATSLATSRTAWATGWLEIAAGSG
ncbi:MAG: DUF362 domain-containing protein [Thermodesulfobacteriota bacterium]